MNTAMLIISIQHQLVLSIGNSTDLTEMLHQFLQVCSLRLESSSSHIFLFQDAENNPVDTPLLDSEISLKHYLSFPSQKAGVPCRKNQQLIAVVNDFYQGKAQKKTTEIDSGLYHCFKIAHLGVLLFEQKTPLQANVQEALLPVLHKLAISCTAAIDHQALIQEIKKRQEVEQEIRYQASHDYITGLCNRLEMERRMRKTIQYCEKNKQSGALLLIDLVHFKNINNVMGHNIGDNVLHQIAMRLKNIVQCNYTVGRFGGAEFMMLLTADNCESPTSVLINAMIERMVSAIEEPVEVQGVSFSLSCYIGYETFNDTSKTVSDVIKNADIAMYEARKASDTNVLAYDPAMSDTLNIRLSYREQIKNALQNNEFELYYQPQFVHLKNIIGAEALLRWDHPIHGYESPAVYIPIAEECDLILHIGEFVLNQACKDIKALEEMTLPDSFKQISINISAKQLAKSDFVESVQSAIEHHKIQASHLKIEITESVMMNNIGHSIDYLEKLRKYGVDCAIDDFGTGHSSLEYLKRLPANLIKIDRAFVANIHQDSDNVAIVTMLINLGKNLNMEVIAEGVENQQELDCLIKLGCYQYQGYYFSRPLATDKFMELIYYLPAIPLIVAALHYHRTPE